VRRPEIYLYILLLLVLPLTFCYPWNSYADYFSGPVVSVLDSDTIKVLHNTHHGRVRLSGIDCPEKSQAW